MRIFLKNQNLWRLQDLFLLGNNGETAVSPLSLSGGWHPLPASLTCDRDAEGTWVCVFCLNLVLPNFLYEERGTWRVKWPPRPQGLRGRALARPGSLPPGQRGCSCFRSSIFPAFSWMSSRTGFSLLKLSPDTRGSHISGFCDSPHPPQILFSERNATSLLPLDLFCDKC